jgi:hypothetical protein
MTNANAVRSLHRFFILDVGAALDAAGHMTTDLNREVVKPPEFGIGSILESEGSGLCEVTTARLLDDCDTCDDCIAITDDAVFAHAPANTG